MVALLRDVEHGLGRQRPQPGRTGLGPGVEQRRQQSRVVGFGAAGGEHALQAVAENPVLAQISGVNLSRMLMMIWLIGGSLAALSGIFYGLNNQINPVIGRDLVLPIFAATIAGGIGSVYGAVLGGFLVGIASNLALMILPSGYSPAVPFLIILGVLIFRPNGILGEARA